MQKIFLTKYSVKGVKALDKLISLSFHLSGTEKRSNIKAIYGPNGSGNSWKLVLIKVSIVRSPLPEKTLATNTESTLTFAGTSWVSMGNIFLSVLKIKKNLVKSSEEIRQQLLLREKLAGNHELLF